MGLVDVVIVEDEHDPPRATVLPAQRLEHLDEQRRVLALVLDPNETPRVGMQSPSNVVLVILPRCWNGFLGTALTPGESDARVEVDIDLIDDSKPIIVGNFVDLQTAT